MLREVESTSDVNRGLEPYQSRVVQYSPFPVLCLAYTRVISQIDGAVRAYAHAYDDHYLTRSKFNCLLTEMITAQTYIQIYIYTYTRSSCSINTFGQSTAIVLQAVESPGQAPVPRHIYTCTQVCLMSQSRDNVTEHY